MPVTPQNGPEESLAEAQAALPALGSNPPASTTVPHPVFDLGLDDALYGSDLDAAQFRGWRYISRDDKTGHNIVAEVSADENTDTHTLHHVQSGGHLDEFVALLDSAEHHPDLQDADYEVRLLRVPSCYVLAAWFHRDDGNGDLLVPLAPTHDTFHAGTAYRPDEFLELLQVAAEHVAAANGTDPPGILH